MEKVAFIGGGSFGTALAILLSQKPVEIAIWDRDEAVVNEINLKKINDKYLKDVTIPEKVKAFSSIKEVVEGAHYIFMTVPSHVVRKISSDLKSITTDKQIIVNVAKGIEEGTLKRLSEVIKEELPDNPVVVLSGPSHAEEVAIGIPTTVVVSSKDMHYAEMVRDLLMAPSFRVYTNSDITGVEIGGAVKNIIALAAGICDGVGYGDNSKAALMTRGMHEIIRIGKKLGGREETFSGLTGMGDLIVTCTSMHSRNRRAGILIGQGYKTSEALEKVGTVVEGVTACRAFYELKEREKVSMPITDGLYKILFEGVDPRTASEQLMARDKKSEIY